MSVTLRDYLVKLLLKMIVNVELFLNRKWARNMAKFNSLLTDLRNSQRGFHSITYIVVI